MKKRRHGKLQVTYYLPASTVIALQNLAEEDTRAARANSAPSVAPSHVIARLVHLEKERRKNAVPVEVAP